MKNKGISTRYSPWKCAREDIGRAQPSEKDKRTSKPLFLGGPLLGSSPGCCGLRGSSLGDTARLGLSQNLGLLNDSRSGGGGLASLARVSLGLSGGGLLAHSLLGSGSLGSLCDSLLGTSLGGGLGRGLSRSLRGRLHGRLCDRLRSGFDGSILLRKLQGARWALGLSELILLNTGLDSLVELRVEDTLGSDVDLVVRLNVLLDSLTTKIGRDSVSGWFLEKMARNTGTDPRGIGDEGEHQNTYLLPLRSFSYTQKWQESAMKTNKN